MVEEIKRTKEDKEYRDNLARDIWHTKKTYGDKIAQNFLDDVRENDDRYKDSKKLNVKLRNRSRDLTDDKLKALLILADLPDDTLKDVLKFKDLSDWERKEALRYIDTVGLLEEVMPEDNNARNPGEILEDAGLLEEIPEGAGLLEESTTGLLEESPAGLLEEKTVKNKNKVQKKKSKKRKNRKN